MLVRTVIVEAIATGKAAWAPLASEKWLTSYGCGCTTGSLRAVNIPHLQAVDQLSRGGPDPGWRQQPQVVTALWDCMHTLCA